MLTVIGGLAVEIVDDIEAMEAKLGRLGSSDPIVELIEQWRQSYQARDAFTGTDEECEPLHAQRQKLCDEICKTRAMSLEGLAAQLEWFAAEPMEGLTSPGGAWTADAIKNMQAAVAAFAQWDTPEKAA